ncbi:hypothetical protein SAMN04487926_1317 [Paraburkholderia steynii]|uniref:Uncharacterized protein n=1 Tax=Paraburkholderia steynii TaxID=1245441 RepID=A0A7Z7BEI8_9BURK|nr:hypothetical protein [Paraburkholderia steynii]SDJ04196.1 hypothetical protein SAMN04487926_1317 [Paraburkholderia steynii]
MNTTNVYHDAEIAGVAYSRASGSALLNLERVISTETRIGFSGVKALRVSDFGLQNVISRVLISGSHRFSTDEIRDHVQWAYSQHDYNASLADEKIAEIEAAVSQGELVLFVIEPSVGAEIVILCVSVQVIDAESRE